MCVAEVAGEDLGPVSSLAAWEPLCPQWSPDGERLTYLEAEIGGVRDARGLFVVGRDGTGRKQVGSLQCVHRVWSGPHELTFETVNNHRAKALVEVWRADVDTGRTRRVFGAELPRLAGSSDERPRWTRDRTRLLVVAGLSKSRPGAPGSERGMGGSIYVLDVGRKTVRQLTAGLWDEDPAWSSDGSEVVFVRGGTSLWVMKADGSGQRKVAGINALGQVAGVEGEGPPPAP
jgi:Tol biopolymer transport system component